MKAFEDYRIADNNSTHWEYCNRHKLPFIIIDNYNQNYDSIAYDVTDLDFELLEISQRVKDLYKSYISFYVLKSHSKFIAKQLLDYLLEN